mmetsp:Transcript_9252/g.56326  ORF Transcript_9252/g.56326 Transcript_9252/m.56326 type:complete len:321 (+) Transcript_9252:565-1527(+)
MFLFFVFQSAFASVLFNCSLSSRMAGWTVLPRMRNHSMVDLRWGSYRNPSWTTPRRTNGRAEMAPPPWCVRGKGNLQAKGEKHVERRKSTWLVQTESEEDLRRYREDRKRLYPKLRNSDQDGEVQGANLLNEEERARRKELLQSILAAQKAMGLQRAAGTMALEVRNVGGSKSGRSEKVGKKAEGKQATGRAQPIHEAHSDQAHADGSLQSGWELEDRGKEGRDRPRGLEALQSYEDSEEESFQGTRQSICDDQTCKGGAPQPPSNHIVHDALNLEASAVHSSNLYGPTGPTRHRQKRKKHRAIPEGHVPKKTLLQKLFS